MIELRMLVACETSGIVRRAFAALGHDAWSCDLLSSEDGSNKHLIGDVREFLNDGWDLLMVAHPPCTRLCNSGVRWLSVPPLGKTREQMWAELEEGAALFSDCLNAPIERIAAENPVMHKHAKALIRNYVPAAQFVQPWWFGHPAFKATGLADPPGATQPQPLAGSLPLLAGHRPGDGPAMDRSHQLGDEDSSMSRNYLVCEGCGEPLDVSDRYYPGIDCVLCIKCAPTFMDLLSEPTSFVERSDGKVPLTREVRQAMLDAHIAAGGHPYDSMATRAVE